MATVLNAVRKHVRKIDVMTGKVQHNTILYMIDITVKIQPGM